MARTFRGVVKNGVIVLEDQGHLPEGAEVTVIVGEREGVTSLTASASETAWEEPFEESWPLLDLLVGSKGSGFSDVSERVDEYLVEFYRRERGDEEP